MSTVEKVPPRTIISKGKAIASTSVSGNLLLQQVEKVPPLTLISKGKPLHFTAASGLKFMPERQQFGLKRVSAPPLALISKGKQLNPTISTSSNTTTEKGIHILQGNIPRPRMTAQTRPRLNIQTRPQLIAQHRRRLISQPQSQLKSKKQLVVKKYENVSAPAPFFGTYKSSKIPRLTNAALALQQDEEGEIDQNTDVEIPDSDFHVGDGDENPENTDVLENVSDSEYIAGLANTFNENRENKSEDVLDTNFVENLRPSYIENEAFTDFVIETADSWKNSTFTKDVYIDAMKSEIKKAHDRLNQQKHRKRMRASDLL